MSKTSRATTLILLLGFYSVCQSAEMSISTDPMATAAHASQEDEHSDDGEDHHDSVEKTVVQASRSGRIADDQPIRVELINREEIEEKAAMRPGNISMLLQKQAAFVYKRHHRHWAASRFNNLYRNATNFLTGFHLHL